MDTIVIGKDVTLVENCEDTWTAGANVTASVEATIIQRGLGSAKLLVDSAATANQILGYKNFTAIDLSGVDTIAFWIYPTKAVSNGDLEFHISETNNIGGTPIEMTIPALTTSVWKRVVVAIPAGSRDAIVSCGIYQNTDLAGFSLYIDDVIAFNSKTFNILGQKGINDPEFIWRFPNIRERLLNGARYKMDHHFGRTGFVQFHTISASADRAWLLSALMGDSFRLIYDDDEVEAVDDFDEDVEMIWTGGLSEVKNIVLPWHERVPLWTADRMPPSW